jgi:glycosyltransferase involved in cell wall biosynthesis
LRPSTKDEASQEGLLSIVVLVFNEAQTVGAVVEEILGRKIPFLHEVIVVDDGSTVTLKALLYMGATIPIMPRLHRYPVM